MEKYPNRKIVWYLHTFSLLVYEIDFIRLSKYSISNESASLLTLFFYFLVQQPNLSHPFHLHGYAFNVIGIGRSPDRNVKKINLKHALDLDRQGLLHRQFNLPPGKDTIAVPNNGYVVLRFRADNPGFWLFHCHFLFHIVIGMNLVFQVGTHNDIPPVPPNFPTCGDHLPPITPDTTIKLYPDSLKWGSR